MISCSGMGHLPAFVKTTADRPTDLSVNVQGARLNLDMILPRERADRRFRLVLPLPETIPLPRVHLAVRPDRLSQTRKLNRSEEHTSEPQSRLHLVCRL